MVGLWRHDPRVPKLIGFARCTGDGVLDATIWDLAIHPYQGAGLGKGLMQVLLERLRAMEVEKVTLFADANVELLQGPGWDLEPRGELRVLVRPLISSGQPTARWAPLDASRGADGHCSQLLRQTPRRCQRRALTSTDPGASTTRP